MKPTIRFLPHPADMIVMGKQAMIARGLTKEDGKEKPVRGPHVTAYPVTDIGYEGCYFETEQAVYVPEKDTGVTQ